MSKETTGMKKQIQENSVTKKSSTPHKDGLKRDLANTSNNKQQIDKRINNKARDNA